MRKIRAFVIESAVVVAVTVGAVALMVPLAASAATGEGLPETKRTRAALYLDAAEVPGFIARTGGPAKVLLLDLRTRAEATYVGMPDDVDALVPFVEHQELMTDWDVTVERCTSHGEPVGEVPSRQRLHV